MQVIAHNCFDEATNNNVGVKEFQKSFPKSLSLLAQREFKGMYEKSTNEERKILGLMAESDEEVLPYKKIKEDSNLKSEPSAWLRSMLEKNLIIKRARGKYQLRDRMFKEYLRIMKPYNENGTYI